MSNIGLTCDVCGRTVQGITFVNGMRFCAKCYQETFVNNNNLQNNAQYTEQLLKENAQLKEEIVKEYKEHLEFTKLAGATTKEQGKFIAELKRQNEILNLALGMACNCAISQEIKDEYFIDVIEDWKNKNGIETVGVSHEELITYFIQQAKGKLK